MQLWLIPYPCTIANLDVDFNQNTELRKSEGYVSLFRGGPTAVSILNTWLSMCLSMKPPECGLSQIFRVTVNYAGVLAVQKAGCASGGSVLVSER
jgi:hypothetical protein